MHNEHLTFVPQLHRHMMQHRFLLAYRGPFSHDITMAMLAMSENRLVQEGAETGTRKKIFNVMMGCLENICSHPEASSTPEKQAMVMLGRNDNDYFIYSGNVIFNADVPELESELSRINELNPEQLRKLYTDLLQTLSAEQILNSEAGLIDIARKSGHKIEFEFSPVDNSSTFFAMKTTIASAHA
jgi:hypothetical protein